jgi:hypothetical protein
MRGRAWVLVHFLAATLLVVAGCSDTTEGRQAITGTITLKGVPLDQGLIEFLPQEADKDGTRGGAMIKDGKYSIPREQGLLPGKYKVVINAAATKLADPEPGVPPGPTKVAPKKNRIPPEYNRATQQVVAVTKGGPNQFDFTIP